MGKKILIFLGVVTLVYTVSGFFIAPLIIQSQIIGQIQQNLGVQAFVREVAFNPYELSLSVKGFEIQDKHHEPLVGFEEFFFNIQLISLVKGVLTLKEVRLLLPFGQLIVRPDGHLNFSDLANQREPNPPSAKTSPSVSSSENQKEASQVHIELFELQQGLLEFHDYSKTDPFHAYLVPIHFSLKNFSTQPDGESSYSLKAEIGDGDSLEWEGTLALNPLRLRGTLAINGIQLPSMWQYVREEFPFAITDGVLTVRTDYVLDASQDPPAFSLNGAELSLKNLKVGERDADPLISIASFEVSGVEVNVTERQVVIAMINSQGGQFQGWRNADGTINYESWIPPQQEEHIPAPSEPQEGAPAQESKPWKVDIQEILLNHFKVVFEDRVPESPVSLALDPIDLKIRHVSTQPEQPIELDVHLGFNQTGQIDVMGQVRREPLGADLALDVQHVGFKPFQPYLDSIADLEIVEGALNLKGNLKYGPLSDTEPMLHYSGMMNVVQLVLRDKKLSEDFVKWANVSVLGISLDMEPTRVSVKEVVAEDLYARVTIFADHTTNISQVFRTSGDQETSESAKDMGGNQEPQEQPETTPAVPVKIGTVRLINASTNFADYSVEPNVETGIQNLNGTIQGLSSEQMTKADVLLEGEIDAFAPVKISGQINPLREEAFTDIALSFKNVELTTISSYSGKFAGYPIKKGKLSLDLRYKLSEKILEAENIIHFEQLTLGEAADSPDATSLPVKLAIALLKDRHGNIDIDLPVRGDLNDPEFQYGELILNVLVNLVTKIVTSPFAALGSLLGGDGEEFSFLEFEPGSADVSLAQLDKLNSLSNALVERPGLQLEITGGYHSKVDQAAMVENELHARLWQVKMAELQKSGLPINAQQGELVLTDEETLQLIRQIYIQQYPDQVFLEGQGDPEANSQEDMENEDEKPKQEIPIQEMKLRLLQDIEVIEAQLRLLAQERGKAIKAYLIEEGNILPEHIFLLDVEEQMESDPQHVRSQMTLRAG
ncbi:MAG: DUF748 domain-containing protein [Nitrospirae bacterium]|nr:DUF748 domain-containing protein [Nitrospirota bacterium]